MLGYEPPEPQYWKALVAMLALAIPAALLLHALLPGLSLWALLTGAVLIACGGAYTVHRRARYDAAAVWEMTFARRDRETYVPRHTPVRRR